jgi:hypothetical protein
VLLLLKNPAEKQDQSHPLMHRQAPLHLLISHPFGGQNLRMPDWDLVRGGVLRPAIVNARVQEIHFLLLEKQTGAGQELKLTSQPQELDQNSLLLQVRDCLQLLFESALPQSDKTVTVEQVERGQTLMQVLQPLPVPPSPTKLRCQSGVMVSGLVVSEGVIPACDRVAPLLIQYV